MRRVEQPLEVAPDDQGRPERVTIGGRERRVEAIHDAWVERGRWWEGEPARKFWRIDADGRFDVSCDSEGNWRLEASWD